MRPAYADTRAETDGCANPYGTHAAHGLQSALTETYAYVEGTRTHRTRVVSELSGILGR